MMLIHDSNRVQLTLTVPMLCYNEVNQFGVNVGQFIIFKFWFQMVGLNGNYDGTERVSQSGRYGGLVLK